MDITIKGIELEKLFNKIAELNLNLLEQCRDFEYNKENKEYSFQITLDIKEIKEVEEKCSNILKNWWKKNKAYDDNYTEYCDLIFILKHIIHSLEVGRNINNIEYIYEKIKKINDNYIIELKDDKEFEKFILIRTKSELNITLFDEKSDYVLCIENEEKGFATHFHPFTTEECIESIIDILNNNYIFICKKGLFRKERIVIGSSIIRDRNPKINKYIKRRMKNKRIAIFTSEEMIKDFG